LITLIAIKHRSLLGVEKEIFEVEYFINIFNTILAPVLAPLFSQIICPIKFRAFGKIN